jgi:hypothetical protein
MPISEELQVDCETKQRPDNVFVDDANPLLAQVAIFARILEQQEDQSEKKTKNSTNVDILDSGLAPETIKLITTKAQLRA